MQESRVGSVNVTPTQLQLPSRVVGSVNNWTDETTQLNESEQSWPGFLLWRHRIVLALYSPNRLETGSEQFSHTVTLDKF